MLYIRSKNGEIDMPYTNPIMWEKGDYNEKINRVYMITGSVKVELGQYETWQEAKKIAHDITSTAIGLASSKNLLYDLGNESKLDV